MLSVQSRIWRDLGERQVVVEPQGHRRPLSRRQGGQQPPGQHRRRRSRSWVGSVQSRAVVDIERGEPLPAAEPPPPGDVPVDDDPARVRVGVAVDDQPVPAHEDRDQRVLHRIAGGLPVPGHRGGEDQQRATALGRPGIEGRASGVLAESVLRSRSAGSQPVATDSTVLSRASGPFRCSASNPSEHPPLSITDPGSMLVRRSVSDLTDLVTPAPEVLTNGAVVAILGVCPRNLPTRFNLTRAVQRARTDNCTARLRSPRKDPLLAASRTASKNNVVSPTGRISFAKIAEPMEVPDLLDLQIDSFDWLVGNEAWRNRVAAALDAGPHRHQHQVRPGGDLRGDLPDRGLQRHHVAVVPRPPVRAAEEHGRRVQGPRRHLRRAAVRHRRVHEQRDRRDQEPDGLHGRLPADDRQGHLRHQRHRAGRGVPAGPLARASTSSRPPTRPRTRTSSPAR